MKNKIRKILFFILYYTGFGLLIRTINNKNNKIPVLLFHRISDEVDTYWEPIKTSYFEQIIKFISKKYTVISIDDLFSGKINNFKNKCIITFDDGYYDFKKNALPILQKYNIPTTLFVATDCILENNIIWTSELNKAIENSKKKEFFVNKKKYSLKTDYDKHNTVSKLLDLLKSVKNKERIKILTDIKKELNYNKPSNLNMLNWHQIKEINKIVDIQSHSVSHPMMTKLEKQELIFELEKSKKDIEENINIDISYFSYPIGDYNQNVVEETSKIYKAAFVVSDNLVKTTMLNKNLYNYKLPRVNITDKNIYELFFRINGFHLFLKKIKK